MHSRPQVNLRDIDACATDEELLGFLVGFAVLAPSSHNTQPWRFRIRSSTVEVWGNEGNKLHESDANNRQLFISVGCALENFLQAAQSFGFRYRVQMFPFPKKSFYVSKVEIEDRNLSRRDNDFLHAILNRHTNRSEYEDRLPSTSLLAAIRAKVGFSNVQLVFATEKKQRQGLSRVVGDATESAFQDGGFRKELSRWIKPSLKRYRDGMPGYNIGIPWFASFIVPLIIRFFPVARQQRKMVEKVLSTTPVLGIIGTKGDAPLDWVLAGRAYEAIALEATFRGLVTAPLAAPIQVGSYYEKLQQICSMSYRPQVFFRMGYSNRIPAQSPRLDVKTVLMRK